eukprot:TRINITY_DN10995_c0_g1_i9.p1 TRINITY_DN10995_c0_g1~~TRINITY_DN10995_c0_g1_i9.p1  ORF type:complete len:298 (+),score=47.39 TRINITY_DN10995_c0_g1_i9:64-957(+)
MCIRDRYFLFLLVALAFFTTAKLCRKFVCAPDGEVDPEEPMICAKRDKNNVVIVGDCPEGMTCDMNDMQNHTIYCHKKIEHKKLPGQKFANSPAECFSGKGDSEGFCRGNPAGSSCAKDGVAECDVDLYCHPAVNICLEASNTGEYCNDYTKCKSNLLCSWEDGTRYRCRSYGVYPNGKLLGLGDEKEICQSDYVSENSRCEEAPQLLGSNVRDNEGDKCEYTRGYPEYSSCGYHEKGKAVCRRGAKDLEKEWKMIIAYLNRKPKCHAVSYTHLRAHETDSYLVCRLLLEKKKKKKK